MSNFLLSIIIFAPWAGALILAFLRGKDLAARSVGLVFSLSTAILSIPLLLSFNAGSLSQFTENHAWLDILNIRYHLDLDGMSLLLVLLTAIVTPTALLASWKIQRSPALFNALFLIIQGAALGVFLAQDFFLWFLFWEFSLIPAYFLIRIWGSAKASHAAYQFVIYTLGGSAFMLLAFAALYACTGSFDFKVLADMASRGQLAVRISSEIGSSWIMPIFIGVFLGLAVKVPLFPFHTWLPAAYGEAPTGASMFLTGIMSKMGVYGFLRILWPIFPTQLQSSAPYLIYLALASVILGAFAALAQKDLKRMIAYSSVNHVNYCLLALFAVATGGTLSVNANSQISALNGALFQMFNHGLSASALFMAIGILESRNHGLRGINDFGAIRSSAPIFATFTGFALFSSLGLPGLNGFVGEFMIFLGVFGLTPGIAAVSLLALFATAFFLLTFFQRVFCGPQNEVSAHFTEINWRERIAFIPSIALMLLLGFFPNLLIKLFNPLVTHWISNLAANS